MTNDKSYFSRYNNRLENDPNWIKDVKYLNLETGEYFKEEDGQTYEYSSDKGKSIWRGKEILSLLEKGFGDNVVNPDDEHVYEVALDAFAWPDDPFTLEEAKRICHHYAIEHNRGAYSSQYISKVEVRGLFGYHSYDYNLNGELSIIFGSNGLGKTTLFNILNCIFAVPGEPKLQEQIIERNVKYLFKIPFESIKVMFVSGEEVCVKQGLDRVIIEYKANEDESILDSILYKAAYKEHDNIKTMHKHYSIIGKMMPNHNDYEKFVFLDLNRANNSLDLIQHVLRQYRTGDRIDEKVIKSALENVNEYSVIEKLFNIRLNALTIAFNEWFNTCFSISDNKQYGLISTEELFNAFINIKSGYSTIDLMKDNFEVVLSDQLAKNSAQKLVNDYVKKYKAMANGECILTSQQKIDMLQKIMMYSAIYPNEQLISRFYEFRANFEYMQTVFEELYYEKDPSKKKIVYRKGKFILLANESRHMGFTAELPFSVLSSGETNMITILFHLLFNTTNRSIVLIDEPEVSLHVAWQMQLVNIIIEVLKRRGMQVIIASHSPFIATGYEEHVVSAEIIEEEND